MSITSTVKSVGYSILESLTAKKGIKRMINGSSVRFPARWSRYYEADYESDNYGYLKRTAKPGMHLIDIGAHLGLFSTVSSQLVGPSGKIVCFEPTPGTFAILKETLRMNGCANVTAVQGAVSSSVGTATFYVSQTAGCNANSLVKGGMGAAAEGYEVKLYTIDSVTAEHALQPAIIKIDAEGAEYDVLRGGVTTFRQFRPKLILGLHPAFIKEKGDTLEGIWELLAGCGYQVEMEGRMIGRDEFCSQTLLFDVHCI